jgi:tetratricopeptide (TPR) repeat protein
MSRPYLTLLLFACAACATPAPPDSAAELGDASDLQVVLDSTLPDGPLAEAWTVYGVTKLAAVRAVHRDDYSAELAARESLAEYWEKRAAAGRQPDAYLDALLELKRAGHLDAYVLAAFSRPGWIIPGDILPTLDLAGFATWSRENLAGHKVETHASIARSVAASVPGDALPSFEELTQNGSSLCEALPQASSAYAAWRAEEAKLPGVPLIGRGRGDFLAALEALRVSGSAAGRDVIWVSEKAADLGFLVGFCETDRNQPAAGVEPLETAVRLNPLVPMWRLELVGALTAAKRFDEARSEIQVAIALTEDDCVRGAAWRKKGYLEIETGELEQAELSYKRSLEYEPGNAMALSELSIILKQRMQRGDTVSPYTPPPGVAPIKKMCPGG